MSRMLGFEAILTGFFFLAFFLGAFSRGSLALAQEKEKDEPTVVQVAGKAQILEQGRRRPDRAGQRLLVGQAIELVGGGEVRLSMANGKVKIKVASDSTVRYDGPVEADGQPWATGPVTRKVAAEEEAPQFFAEKGKLEIEVAPGRRLRILCPLILAAVRGTVFTIEVAADGTSRLNTIEGQVATYGRQGEMGLSRPGQSFTVTAREYTSYLATKGVEAPLGDWRKVPANEQERVDNQALGPVFSPESDLLAAVLNNPNASPTSGLDALAVEDSASEEG